MAGEDTRHRPPLLDPASHGSWRTRGGVSRIRRRPRTRGRLRPPAGGRTMSGRSPRSSLPTLIRSTPRELQLLGVMFAVAVSVWGLALLIATLEYPRIQRFDERV